MIVVAQLTDCHIRAPGQRAYGKVDTAAFLSRAVVHLNALTPRPVCVMVTGDLADFAKPAEYDHFLDLTRDLQMPMWPVPGNHDGPHLWEAFPRTADLRGDGHGYTVDAGELRVVLLDSSLPGKPHGLFDEARAAWLDETLLAGPDKPTLLGLHHPPFITGITHMDVQNLHGAQLLADVLMRHPQVLAVTAGHVHRTVVTSFAGRPATIAPSPAHAVDLDLSAARPPSFVMEPPGVMLHTWTPGNAASPFGALVSHVSHIGDFEGPHPFFDASGKLLS